jgi:hypothetical protein
VDIALIEGAFGQTVVLEPQPDAGSEGQRYRIVDLRPLTVEPVARGATGQFLSDHCYECPGHANH